jgi:hypothetical protein
MCDFQNVKYNNQQLVCKWLRLYLYKCADIHSLAFFQYRYILHNELKWKDETIAELFEERRKTMASKFSKACRMILNRDLFSKKEVRVVGPKKKCKS